MRIEERPIIRGRRERPRDRLPTNDTGLEAQPGRFSHGMWACILFVSTEAMFFLALFTTYFFLRARIPEWQPIFQRCAEECEKPHWNSTTNIFGAPVPLVAINTVALLASSVTMQLAVNAIKKGDRRALRNWLIPTVVLGVWFISGQLYEYTRLGFLPDNGIFAELGERHQERRSTRAPQLAHPHGGPGRLVHQRPALRVHAPRLPARQRDLRRAR